MGQFLLLLLVLPAAGCGAVGQKAYVSAAPPFTVRYPGTWRQTADVSEFGPLVVFSPDATVGADSTRITLLVTEAEVRATMKAYVARPSISIEQSLGELPNGQRGYRWFVAIPPTAVVIEAFALPRNFDRIKGIGESMARAIQASAGGAKGGR